MICDLSMEFQTVFNVIKRKEMLATNFITTMCSLDQVLGGGVPLGLMTQIAGESGIGKTQLCFQLCLTVQIPIELGGMGGEAVYFDTENIFKPSRLLEMGEKLIHYFHQTANLSSDISQKMSTKKFLSKIYLFHCHDAVQLLAGSHQMFEFLQQHPKVKLVVVDSIASCIRHEEDAKTRIKFLNTLAENFKKLAFKYNVAVVVVNQVTTKFATANGAITVPALGQMWSYVPAIKIMLIKQNDERWALLYKSPSQLRASVQFRIDSSGFRTDDCMPIGLLTQNITNELLCNDFELCDEISTATADDAACEEKLSEKWILLSQRQLKVENIDSCYGEINVDEFDEVVAECLSFTKPSSQVSEDTNVEAMQKSGKENCLNRSISPILMSRPIKKRKIN